MAMRPAQQRYVPPSRRGGAAAGDEASTEQRGLAGLETGPSQVQLVVLREPEGEDAADGGLDLASCPLDIEPQEGSQPPALRIFYPERLPRELLRWFAEALPGGTGRLEFPPSLSKQERARWHSDAQRAGLHTESVGVGEARYLTISSAARQPSGAEQGDGGGAPGRPRLTREQQERARRIYDWCQMEGGKHWERSRGEIEAMVASGEPLPADLQQVVDRRMQGERVVGLLKGGKPSEALDLLAQHPQLAWVKDSQSGSYPIHLAAWKGCKNVVLFLASLPGCLEQRDGRRDTALAVARRRGHQDIEALLLEAAGGSSAAAGPGSAAGDEEYMSWTAEERLSYWHGGSGPPPGLHGRGGRAGRGRGRGGAPGRISGRGAAVYSPQRQEGQPRCPW